MATDDDVLLPPRVVGPSLTAAGLAAWMLLQAREHEAAECGEIQEFIDKALRQGQRAVGVPRRVATRAVELWETTAELAESWASKSKRPEDAAGWRLQAKRLRSRADSVRKLVSAIGHGT